MSAFLVMAANVLAGVCTTRASGRAYRPMIETLVAMGQTVPPVAVLAIAALLLWRAFGPADHGDPVATSLTAFEKANRLTVFSAQLAPVVSAAFWRRERPLLAAPEGSDPESIRTPSYDVVGWAHEPCPCGPWHCRGRPRERMSLRVSTGRDEGAVRVQSASQDSSMQFLMPSLA